MDASDLYQAQRQSILDGETEEAVRLAREALEEGADLLRCIDEGYVAGIREVGRLWEEGEYFLPELVQGAEAMKAAMDVLRPGLVKDEESDTPRRKKVVIGTVAGDIHDIGKTLVATVLEANGFEVLDLGRDVPVDAFVDAVEQGGVDAIGMSALLTTTMVNQKKVLERLEERGLRDRVKVLVGGAPVNRQYTEEIGADGTAGDAMGALAAVQRLLGGAA